MHTRPQAFLVSSQMVLMLLVGRERERETVSKRHPERDTHTESEQERERLSYKERREAPGGIAMW